MRKIGIRSAKPTDGGFLPASGDDEEVWYKREWRLITLLAIMIVAFVIRFIFAYGVSAGSDFALSGGSGASSHAHMIESIINGSFAFTDPALNYPYGSVGVNPPLMDILLSGVAMIVSAFGVSAGTAAAGTLAFSAPIFAALTCWPVYLIGRNMFNDEKIGLLAALLYAFFALLIMTTVFSNGTEFAFVGFLFAFMIYFLLKTLEGCDKAQPSGFRVMLKEKTILKNLLITGILFAMIAMSWNQFRIILLALVFFMAAQAVVDRLRGKEITPTVGIYSSVIMMGILLSAPIYIAAGLWDAVFSGPFIVAILSVALAVFFGKTAKTTWVLMLPITLIIAGAALLVISLISGDLFSAVVNGNSTYTNELMANLASSSSRTSISSMAAFFGWLTVWLPLVMFLYMFYKYRANMDSRKYTFTMWWIIAMFCIGWFSTSYAVLAGAGFAVASAALILMAIRMTDLKGYFADMRGNGIKAAARKALKPIPLATTVAIVVLILAPNLVNAVDASTPTNTEDGNGYFGGLGYTIMTDDVNSINTMWGEFSDVNKNGALVAWFGYSTEAVSRGGFDSVTDLTGGGASAMSAILLANSGSAATATMAVRLLLDKDISKYASAIGAAGLNYNIIKGYIDNPSTAVDEVKKETDIYGGISQSVTEENALYLVLTHYITSTISEPKVNDLYNSICSISGESITYVAVDRSMLPLYYGDRSYFSTLAYLGNYSVDMYGAPTNFFTYDTYSGYASYKDAMYETFFWKALIGMSPAEAGFYSSIDYLNYLALSDGSVKANPGYGLANYKIAYWHVLYNPEDKATHATDGWEDMDAFDAIAKQNSEGGTINFVNGVVMLEYDPTMNNEVSGKVSYATLGSPGVGGIQVSVFVETDYDSSGVTGYVKRSTVFTGDDGSYTVLVPKGADYYVVFSSGTTTLATGSVIETRQNMTSSASNLTIPATSLSGTAYISNDPFKPYTGDAYVVIEGAASGTKYQTDMIGGNFVFNDIIPDIYTVTLFSPSGTTINSGTVIVNVGANVGYRASATTGMITVTVTTDVGAKAPNGTVIEAQDISTGVKYTGVVDDGQAKIYVVPSTYTIYATGSKVSASNPTTTVSNGGNSTASLTVYDARNISVSGAPSGSLVTLMSFGYMASLTTTSFSVPASTGAPNDMYTAYAVSGGKVYYGTTTGTSITLTNSDGYSVKGVVKDKDGNPFSATVSFIMASGATFIFTSDEDGAFDVMLPNGTYTMYIFGSGSALIRGQTISGSTDLGDVRTTASRDLTMNLNYRTNMSSSTTRGVAFVDIKMSISTDREHFITIKTDPTGKSVFTVPQGYSAVMTTPGFNTSRFVLEDQTSNFAAGTSNTSNTWSIAASGSSGSYVKTVSVTNSVSVKLTLYNSSSTTYEGTSLTGVIPGQYTAEIKGTSGSSFNGTVYIYPGQSGSLNIQTTNVVRVELNASTNDVITVTATDDERGEYFVDSSNPLVYYLERNKSFYFTALSGTGDTEQIAYASVTNITSPTTLNLSNKAEKAVISGYVGVTADGTLTVTYGGVTIPFSISGGSFDITVPRGTSLNLSAKLSQTIDYMEYTYTGSTSMIPSEVIDGATIRFPVTTSSSSNTLVELSGSSFNFVNGRGSFTLSVKNTGSYNATYNVIGGPGWVLDKAYALSVNAGMTGTVVVEGRYNPDTVGAGNEELAVMVRSINGNTVGTYVLDGSAFSSGPSSPTYVDISGTAEAFADAVSGNEYMYAVTITNNDRFLKTATVSATIVGGGSNWTLVYSDKDGGMIFPQTGTNSFKVNGFDSTVIYIKLMSRSASVTEVPAINVTVTMPGQTLDTNSSSKVSVIGSTATINNMSAQPAEMEAEDMSASGNNIFGGPSPAPPLTIALVALAILAFIAMLWFGIKKGVFVRKR